MGAPNFNFIAPFYDSLARIAFGRAITESAELFISGVKDAKNILVLGGGTGKFLPRLLKDNPAGKIAFIDASSGMILRAKKRMSSERIRFIKGTENSIPPDELFDAVLTFYYLDLFENENLPGVVHQITNSLTPSALWLAADFVDTGKWWQKPLLLFMYFFFRISSGLTTRKLPDWITVLKLSGFGITASKQLKRGFIQTLVFERTSQRHDT